MKLFVSFIYILTSICYSLVAQVYESKLTTKTLVHQGKERTYHIYLPENFDKVKSLPMVLALHGGGGEGSKFEKHTTNGTLTVEADKRNLVLVFPEGIGKAWNDGRKEIFRKKKSYDDVGFISKVIDKMIADYNIDAKRVYATGISNGGFMSIRLALELSEKIAAVAPVTAQVSQAMAKLQPAQTVSFMMLNGTKDPLVPYNGGDVKIFKFGRSRGKVLSTGKTIEIFKNFNSCEQEVIVEKLPDKAPYDKTVVEIHEYKKCKNNSEVVLVKVIGGGHTWPGGKQYLRPKRVGVVSKEINASALILNFFLKHSRD